MTGRQDQATAVLSGIHVGRVAAPLGQRLVERELVEQIGVSRTTIREVLRELAAEGLVVVIPQKGAVVYAPTPEEAQELYAVRAALEALTIERFIARAPEEKIEELKATLAEVERVSVDGGDIREMLRAKDHFYGVLLDGAASPTIQQILNGVQARVRLLRATSLSQPGRPQQVVVEIRALVEAIAARDVERATRLCSAHLNNAAATGISAL